MKKPSASKGKPSSSGYIIKSYSAECSERILSRLSMRVLGWEQDSVYDYSSSYSTTNAMISIHGFNILTRGHS